MTDAVVFDLDGVLLESRAGLEPRRRRSWWRARRPLERRGAAARHDGHELARVVALRARRARRGAATPGRGDLAPSVVGAPARRIYRERLPVRSTGATGGGGAARVPARGRSASRPLQPGDHATLFLDAPPRLGGPTSRCTRVAPSERGARRSPAPDVYLEAARRLGVGARRLRGGRGLRRTGSARPRRAGMRVDRPPEPAWPPAADALDLADAVIELACTSLPGSSRSGADALRRAGSAGGEPSHPPTGLYPFATDEHSELSDNEFLFTSESVTEGHPDKIADQISDGVLDAVHARRPRRSGGVRDAGEHRARGGVGRDLHRHLRGHPGRSRARRSARSATRTPTSASLPTPAP